MRQLAEEVGTSARELLELNKEIKGLQLTSTLMKGTRVLTEPVESEDHEYVHWSFPEDEPSGCPSYMMASCLRSMDERRPVQIPSRVLTLQEPVS